MINRWSPFSDLLALNRELMNRMGAGTAEGQRAARTWAPPVESFYHNNSLIVRVWIPGIDPSKVDVKVSGNLLSVKGERTFPYQVPEDQYFFSEVAYGSFERTVTLPEGLAFDQVKAKYINGVLDITLPIHEGVLPKKVPIEVSASSERTIPTTR